MAKFDRMSDPSLGDYGMGQDDFLDGMNHIWDQLFSGNSGNLLASFYPESMEKVLTRLGYTIETKSFSPVKGSPKQPVVVAIKPGEKGPKNYKDALDNYSVGEVIGKEFQKILIEAFVWAHNYFINKDAEN